MPRKEKIQIVVITSAADVDDDFPRQQPLEVVFRKALGLVGGQNQPDQFTLEYNDQPLEGLHDSIGDFAERYGWGDAVELELVPKPEVI